MKTIAERIREGMEIRNLKQVDIVEKTGINKGALSSYLSGKYQPKQNNIYLIAKALDVNEAWLMGHDVPMERRSDSISTVQNGLNQSPSKHKIEILARNLDELPDDDRDMLIKNFEDTIDIYLKARGIKTNDNKEG